MLRDEWELLKTSQRIVLTKASDGEKLGGCGRRIEKRGGKKKPSSVKRWQKGGKAWRLETPAESETETGNKESLRRAVLLKPQRSLREIQGTEAHRRYQVHSWYLDGGPESKIAVAGGCMTDGRS